MNDPWANRHPEWAQAEGEAITRAEKKVLFRMMLGSTGIAVALIVIFVLAIRDHLPPGW